MTLKTTVTLTELLDAAIQHHIEKINISIPCRVESYDASSQTADLQPEIKRVGQDANGDRVEIDLPVIPNVPVAFPRAGDWFVSMPVSVGDKMFVVFSSRSLDTWRSSGENIAPNDKRVTPLNGAVAIPANLYPNADALNNADSTHMTLGNDAGGRIYLRSDGEIHLYENNAAEYIALAQKTFNELDALRSTLDSLVTAFNSHTHSGVTSGGGVTGSPLSGASGPSAVGSVAASKVKAT